MIFQNFPEKNVEIFQKENIVFEMNQLEILLTYC